MTRIGRSGRRATAGAGDGRLSESVRSVAVSQYIIQPVRLRQLLPLFVAVAIASTACGRDFGRDIEYEEQIYLALDGSATVVVNASIPALVALRGLRLDPSPRARFDRQAVRAAYEAPGVRVARISRPWWRDGRRFVQVRLEVADIRRLGADPAFAPAAFRFDRSGDTIEYQETLGPPAGGPVGDVGWTGRELVAFRAHLPSRILYHNVRNLDDGLPGQIGRGNILSWEQTLTDRLRGVPAPHGRAHRGLVHPADDALAVPGLDGRGGAAARRMDLVDDQARAQERPRGAPARRVTSRPSIFNRQSAIGNDHRST